MKFFLKANIARVVNLIMLFIVTWTIFNLKYYKLDDRVIEHDVKSYYAYLPATFIYDDIKLKFLDTNPKKYTQWFWPSINAKDERVIKTSMGMSYLYAPFFFVAHWSAEAAGYPADGYSLPYRLALSLCSIVFLAIGLYYLRKTLLRHFNQATTAITTLAIVFGTNLIFYSVVQMAYSHVFSFALFAMFIYFLEPWLEHGKWKHTLLLGLLVGLITLIRPTNGLIILLFPLYGITKIQDFGDRLLLFWNRKVAILVMIGITLLVWFPQLLYWHHVTGDWLYFSYGEERFFFSNPKFVKGLFGFQKGWLLYTPMMAIAIFGIILSWRKKREWRWALTIFIVLNVYVILSWWCWWYGGSFGQRAFIESYALLALPLGLVIWHLRSKHFFLRAGFYLAFTFLICLNLFQARQMYGGHSMHHDAMTKEAYMATFFSLDRPDNWEELLQHPSYEAAMEDKAEYYTKLPEE